MGNPKTLQQAQSAPELRPRFPPKNEGQNKVSLSKIKRNLQLLKSKNPLPKAQESKRKDSLPDLPTYFGNQKSYLMGFLKTRKSRQGSKGPPPKPEGIPPICSANHTPSQKV